MTWQLILFLALVGACAGSFAATLGLRASAKRPWAAGRSSCDHCATPLAAQATLPLVSYAVRLGRCSGCQGRINASHPLGEASGAALMPLMFFVFDPGRAALLVVLAMGLLATSIVDIRTMRLPDPLTALIGVACLALAVLAGAERMLTGALSMAVLLSLAQLLRFAAARFGADPGLGFGDVKLLAVLALWLGAATPFAVAIAAASGLMAITVIKPKDGRLPFGPFIAAAFFAVGVVQEMNLWPAV